MGWRRGFRQSDEFSTMRRAVRRPVQVAGAADAGAQTAKSRWLDAQPVASWNKPGGAAGPVLTPPTTQPI